MRNGITPVVAIVLLLMMTVAASGGAYAWMTQVQDEAQEDAARGLSTGVDLRDVRCRGINISFTASNTGDTALSSDEADVYVRADGDLLGAGTADVSGAAFLQPGGVGSSHVTLPETTRRNVRYEIEVVFDDDDHATTAFCRSQGTMIGEAHRVDVSGTSWTTVDFLANHSDPVVLATTNTVDTGDHPLIPQARNVQQDSAEVRLCEHENGEGCEEFGTETLGVVVLDGGMANATRGLQTGTATLPSTNGGNRAGTSIAFTRLDGPAVGFVTQRGVNEDRAFPVWVTGADDNTLNVGYCDHNESDVDGCEAHGQEQVSWLAVDDDRLGIATGDANRTAAKYADDNWASVSYDLDGPVVGLGMIQGDEGGQDPKVSEVRNVGASGLDVHFCEHDADDVCNGHSDNYLAWLAVEEGMILR